MVLNLTPLLTEQMAVGGRVNLRPRYVGDDDEPVKIIVCIDCRKTIDCGVGELEQVKTIWGVCDRCKDKRNGAKLAQSPKDLGIG
jgi:hypothetical protein